jgi:tetratricopeptide (TPR) repeat protein
MKMMKTRLAVIIASCLFVQGLSAASVAVLLEQGIYTEETVGDLPRAIEIYSEIVADQQANRKYIAEALFRLGRCYAEEGQSAVAVEELQKLVAQFPEQEYLVKRAKSLMAELQPEPLFPELVGCRLNYPVSMFAGDAGQSKVDGQYAFYQTDMIDLSWSVEKALESRLENFEVFLVPEDGDLDKTLELALGLPGTARTIPPRHFEDAAPGEYTLRIAGYIGGVESVKGEAKVQVKPVMYAQLGLDEVLSNRDIRFISAQQSLNTGGTIKTRGFINSDFVHISSMFDGNNDEVEFTEKHENNIYRYRATLNHPVAPGEFYLLGSEGWKEGMIKKVSGSSSEFQYHMNHRPGGNVPTRRVEIFRLPKGAELLETTPANLPYHLRNGQVEIFVDTVIPAGGSLLTGFRYRLSAESNKYVKQIIRLKKRADGSKEKLAALEQIEAITARATFHLGALVELAKLVPEAEHNHQRIVKAAELASMFGYHTGGLIEVAKIAAKAEQECTELDEILEQVVLNMGGGTLQAEIADIRSRLTELQQSADYQTLEEALEGQKTLFADKKKVAPLELQPAPWEDGEVLSYQISTKAGVGGGQQFWMVSDAAHDGKVCWEIEQRTIVPMGNTTMFSRVLVEKDSFKPIKSNVQCMTIDVKGEYREGVVEMQKGDSDWEIKVDGKIYDNEQAMYLMRRLPLKEGYEASFHVMTLLGGSAANEVRIKVVGREKVDVPAGTFDCWKINLQVYVNGNKTLMEQDFWCAVDGREMVKISADLMDIELVAIEDRSSLKTLRLDEHGVRLNLPENWLGYELPEESFKGHEIVRLLSPEMKVEAFLSKDLHSEGQSLKSVANQDAERMQHHYKDYVVREDSRGERVVKGTSGYVFAADYGNLGKAVVEYRAYFMAGPSIFWLVFRGEPGQFDSFRMELDEVIGGLTVDS